MAFLAALVTALHVALVAPGHAPKVNVQWPYSVRATVAGKPVRGKITVQIVDPLGGVHPVEFGKTTRVVRNFAFNGVFRDFIIWTPDSRGIPLTLRITVVAAGARKVVSYRVTPRE